MTNRHPLDGLLSTWQQVEEGQRQAIARDFRSRTGGMLSSVAFPIPRVLALVSVFQGKEPQGVLMCPSSSGVCLPSAIPHPGESLEHAAVRALGAELADWVPRFECVGAPAIYGDDLVIVMGYSSPYVLREPLPEGLIVHGELSELAPAWHKAALARWRQIAPLRIAIPHPEKSS